MERSRRHEGNVIYGRVTDKGSGVPIRNAEVRLLTKPKSAIVGSAQEEGDERKKKPIAAPEDYTYHSKVLTDEDGRFRFAHLDASLMYMVEADPFGKTESQAGLTVADDGEQSANLLPELNLYLKTVTYHDDPAQRRECTMAHAGKSIIVGLQSAIKPLDRARLDVNAGRGTSVIDLPDNDAQVKFIVPGRATITGVITDRNPNSFGEHAQAVVRREFPVADADVNMIGGQVGVALQRTAAHQTPDQALWVAIRNRTRAISFGPYREFIDRVLNTEDRALSGIAHLDNRLQELGANLHGVGSYLLLKLATEAYLLVECGVRVGPGRFEHEQVFERVLNSEESARLNEFIDVGIVRDKLREYLGEQQQLPYITRVIEASFPELNRHGLWCDRVVSSRVNEPLLLELIWSYWLEEGMLVQTMNAITRRFQNVRAPGDRDPLSHFELDPLRRVNNLLWGLIQDELHLLSVRRRAYEYSHQYGLSLYGRAAGSMQPADNRSKFLEAFHNLLHLTSIFYKEDNDTTVIADGFPLLNALKEVHLILAQGAHNQFGDLPWTARAEMMTMQYILARPEVRDFLQSRPMVPYKEAWMPQVDTMKTLQGWSDVTVTHFRDLAVYGEQILLSVRYGDWIDVTDEDSAKNWARYWRPEIQQYLHAYRAVTAVDLTNPDMVDATVPAFHLRKRLAVQQRAR